MSNNETLYESQDNNSPLEKGSDSKYNFSPQVQGLGLPIYDELRKVASRCEGGEETIHGLSDSLLALLEQIENEIDSKEKAVRQMDNFREEVGCLKFQMDRMRSDREDVEVKISDLEAEFVEERKKMMKQIELLERKSSEYERVIRDLNTVIDQNENEYRWRIEEMNNKYQQLQENYRENIAHMEEMERLYTIPCEKMQQISLAAEIEEETEKMMKDEATNIKPNVIKEDKTDISDTSNDPSENFLTAYNLIIMFIFTTLTVVPPAISTSTSLSWEELFSSALDPFLMSPTSMPPI